MTSSLAFADWQDAQANPANQRRSNLKRRTDEFKENLSCFRVNICLSDVVIVSKQ